MKIASRPKPLPKTAPKNETNLTPKPRLRPFSTSLNATVCLPLFARVLTGQRNQSRPVTPTSPLLHFAGRNRMLVSFCPRFDWKTKPPSPRNPDLAGLPLCQTAEVSRRRTPAPKTALTKRRNLSGLLIPPNADFAQLQIFDVISPEDKPLLRSICPATLPLTPNSPCPGLT